jgi:hypothetical protein
MTSRVWSRCVVVLTALGLAACAGEHVTQPDMLSAVRNYYDRYATEEGGLCNKPQFGVVTASSIEEQNADRLVLRVRYVYSTPLPRSEDFTTFYVPLAQPGKTGPSMCKGVATRSFTIAKRTDGFEVLQMTGPQRRGIKIIKIDTSKVW